jgi:hypothetical protein
MQENEWQLWETNRAWWVRRGEARRACLVWAAQLPCGFMRVVGMRFSCRARGRRVMVMRRTHSPFRFDPNLKMIDITLLSKIIY